MKTRPIHELKKRLLEIAYLSSIVQLLDWDQNVYMPPKAADARALSIAELSSVIHGKFLAIDADGLLTKLVRQLGSSKLKGKDRVIVAETWRSFEREKKFPDAFLRELTETTSKAQSVWAEARRRNDFKLFLPWLEKIVKLKRQEAEYLGYKKSPYDALLDLFEPGMTSEEVSKILGDLKNFLVLFLRKIKASKIKIHSGKVKGKFPIARQAAFNETVARKMGFDFDAGRIDTTVHPFASGIHPHDVRITTRYSETDTLDSLGTLIHETGHGLYDQGLPAEHFGTPLAESISLGIHESQSRMWENLIGRSEPFWKHFYPLLQKEFPVPFKRVPLKEFYAIINQVVPSLIRVEADEVTYNLHIILRFEIEKLLIEGTLRPKDVPKAWNEKMKEYFGLKVPSDSLGVLQDVHWSAGLIGYFPTYSLGNLYSAQFYAAMKKDIPDIEAKISKGQFGEIREWLRTHIHSRGKLLTAKELVKDVSGSALDSGFFTDYLKKKYSKIYGLKASDA